MKKGNLSAQEWHERFEHQARWTISIRNYLFKLFDFSNNSWMLEVGCGTCAVLSQLPVRGPQLFGIDINIEFLSFSNQKHNNLHLTHGDGHLLPYPTDQFDLVYCHYLLLWVRDPITILQEFVRVGKPGSTIFIVAEPDYGGRIDFPPTLEAMGRAQIKSLQSQGADPMLGRKIAAFCKQAGIHVIESGILGSQSSPTVDRSIIDSEQKMLKHDLAGSLTDKKLNELLTIDLEAWMDSTRVLYVPTFYLYGKNPHTPNFER